MSSGLFDDNVDPEPAVFLKGSNSVSVGKAVKNETKTVQQRNREKIHKKKEALAKAAKEKRISDNQLFRVKSIRKEITKESNEHLQRQEKRKIDYDTREKFGTKKFGRYVFADADLDVNLSDEITGNLRTMKVNPQRSLRAIDLFFLCFIRRKEISFTIDSNPCRSVMSSKLAFAQSTEN